MLTAAVMIFLLILSVYDLREKALPVRILLIGAALIVPVSLWENEPAQVIAGCVPGVLLLAVSLALPHCLGAGDGLVVMTVGAAWGLFACLSWLFMGFLLAAVVSLWKMLVQKESGKEQIALLPFLFIAAIGEFLL
ncbi:MAG: prepilin peptidase [Lachnospiraceae bacterium]|nr:prepilin peptidase [Lachnospiraceae bacterium]